MEYWSVPGSFGNLKAQILLPEELLYVHLACLVFMSLTNLGCQEYSFQEYLHKTYRFEFSQTVLLQLFKTHELYNADTK